MKRESLVVGIYYGLLEVLESVDNGEYTVFCLRCGEESKLKERAVWRGACPSCDKEIREELNDLLGPPKLPRADLRWNQMYKTAIEHDLTYLITAEYYRKVCVGKICSECGDVPADTLLPTKYSEGYVVGGCRPVCHRCKLTARTHLQVFKETGREPPSIPFSEYTRYMRCFRNIARTARYAGKRFELHPYDFIEVAKSPCAACGKEGIGVTLIDYRGDYTPTNIRPCCSACRSAALLRTEVKRNTFPGGTERREHFRVKEEQVRKSMKRLNLPYMLTLEEFADIAEKPCQFCSKTGPADSVGTIDVEKGVTQETARPACRGCRSMLTRTDRIGRHWKEIHKTKLK